MSTKVIEIRPFRKMDVALMDTLIQDLVQKLLRPRGFRKEFETQVVESVRESMRPLHAWYGQLCTQVNVDLTAEQHEAVEQAFGTLLGKVQADVLRVVLAETYLRVSAVQQAKDAGLEVVPIKDV